MAKKKASAKKSNVKKSGVKKAVKKVISKKSVAKSKIKASAKAKKASKAPTKKAMANKSLPKAKLATKAPKAKADAVPKKSSSAKKRTTAKPSPNKAMAGKTAAAKVLDLSGFVTPLDDRLMVQTASSEKRTAGGLYIPETVADVSGNLHGYVVAVGRGHQNKKGHVLPMDVKVGDQVVFSSISGSKITIKNQDLIILREGDVLGVISK